MQVDVIPLLNDDEGTPIKMIGKKMVPILEHSPGKYMGESLDIIQHVEGQANQKKLVGRTKTDVADWLAATSSVMYRLCMPRWVIAPLPEFDTEHARAYFITKKQKMIGLFSEEFEKSLEYIDLINMALEVLGGFIQRDTAVNGQLSYDDIHLFAALRSLSIVDGITYPEHVEGYRTMMSHLSGVPLHDNIKH